MKQRTCKRELRKGELRKYCGGTYARKLTRSGKLHNMPGVRYQAHVCDRCRREVLLVPREAEVG